MSSLSDWRRDALRRAVVPLVIGLIGLVGFVLVVAYSGVVSIIGWGVVGVAVAIALSLVFLEVGYGEDRERARERARARSTTHRRSHG